MATQKSLVKTGAAEGPDPFVVLQNYAQSKHIVLCPPATVRAELGYGYVVSIEEVKISKDYRDKQVYKVGSRKGRDGNWEDEVDFHATTKVRIGNAAGVSILPTRRTDNRMDPLLVEMQATGFMKKGDGTFVTKTRTYEFDLREVEKQVTKQQTDKGGTSAQIKARVEAEMQQKRRHKVALCETGAISRVLKDLCGLDSSYPISALDETIIVPRVDFRPDPSDPIVKRALIEHGLRAGQEIFGGQTALPAGRPAAAETSLDNDKFVEAEVIERGEQRGGGRVPSEVEPEPQDEPTVEESVTAEPTPEEKAEHHLADLKLMEPTDQIRCINELLKKKGRTKKADVDLAKLTPTKRIEIILGLEKLPDSGLEGVVD